MIEEYQYLVQFVSENVIIVPEIIQQLGEFGTDILDLLICSVVEFKDVPRPLDCSGGWVSRGFLTVPGALTHHRVRLLGIFP